MVYTFYDDTEQFVVLLPIRVKPIWDCHNNPIRYIDPSGHWKSEVHYDDTLKWIIENYSWIIKTYSISESTFKYYAEIIAKACKDVDSGSTGPMPWQDQSRHFNRNDSGVDSRQVHADESMERAITLFKNGKIADALKELGTGLHPIQDIDAHGNIGTDWLGMTTFASHAGPFDNTDDIYYDWIYTSDKTQVAPSRYQYRYKTTKAKTIGYLNNFLYEVRR